MPIVLSDKNFNKINMIEQIVHSDRLRAGVGYSPWPRVVANAGLRQSLNAIRSSTVQFLCENASVPQARFFAAEFSTPLNQGWTLRSRA
jgi:hypothetical protein